MYITIRLSNSGTWLIDEDIKEIMPRFRRLVTENAPYLDLQASWDAFEEPISIQIDDGANNRSVPTREQVESAFTLNELFVRPIATPIVSHWVFKNKANIHWASFHKSFSNDGPDYSHIVNEEFCSSQNGTWWRSDQGGDPFCSTCPEGFFCINGKVHMCPRGTYNDKESQTQCTPCPAGRYGSGLGFESETQCAPCPSGTYSDQPGLTSVDQCQLCPVGTFEPTAGNQQCRQCPLGTIGLTEGGDTSDVCEPCPRGTYWDIQTGNCTMCPSGMFGNVAGATNLAQGCLACPSNTYNNQTGAQTCVNCPLHTTSGSGSNDFSDCRSCEHGQEGRGEGLGCVSCLEGTASEDGKTCHTCETPYVSRFRGATSCELCPPGFERVTAASCRPCSKGMYSSNGEICRPCDDWTIADEEGQQQCKTCSIHQKPNENKSGCESCIENGQRCAPGISPINVQRNQLQIGEPTSRSLQVSSVDENSDNATERTSVSQTPREEGIETFLHRSGVLAPYVAWSISGSTALFLLLVWVVLSVSWKHGKSLDMLFSRTSYVPDNVPIFRKQSALGAITTGVFLCGVVVIFTARWYSFLRSNRFVTDGTDLLLRYTNGEDDFPVSGRIQWSGFTSEPGCAIQHTSMENIKGGDTHFNNWSNGTMCFGEFIFDSVILQQGSTGPWVSVGFDRPTFEMAMECILESPVPGSQSIAETWVSAAEDGWTSDVTSNIDVTLGRFESELNPGQNWTGGFLGTVATEVQRTFQPPASHTPPQWTVHFNMQNSVASTNLRLRQTWQDFVVATVALITSVMSLMQGVFPTLERVIDQIKHKTWSIDGILRKDLTSRLRDLIFGKEKEMSSTMHVNPARSTQVV